MQLGILSNARDTPPLAIASQFQKEGVLASPDLWLLTYLESLKE